LDLTFYSVILTVKKSQNTEGPLPPNTRDKFTYIVLLKGMPQIKIKKNNRNKTQKYNLDFSKNKNPK
jgi:hypothetical protein